MIRRLLLFLSNRRWLRLLITRYPFSRSFAWRFIAGETSDTALAAVAALRRKGVASTLDLLGESVSDERAARRSAEDYLALLDEIHARGLESRLAQTHADGVGPRRGGVPSQPGRHSGTRA
ncbi:MAG: hypothetical protein WKH64_05495 [Chloroflexia bacterium]